MLVVLSKRFQSFPNHDPEIRRSNRRVNIIGPSSLAVLLLRTRDRSNIHIIFCDIGFLFHRRRRGQPRTHPRRGGLRHSRRGEEPSPFHPFITPEGPDDGAGSDKIYLLTVEGCAILSLRGLPECLLWWAAAHFVLNQRVANPVRNTVWFMFEHVFQVHVKSARLLRLRRLHFCVQPASFPPPPLPASSDVAVWMMSSSAVCCILPYWVGCPLPVWFMFEQFHVKSARPLRLRPACQFPTALSVGIV